MRTITQQLVANTILVTTLTMALLVPDAHAGAQTEDERMWLDAAAVALDPQALAGIQALAQDERVGRALDLLRERDEAITSLQIRLAEIPTYDERAAERADVFAELLRDVGLRDVHQDEAGNVIGSLRGAAPNEPVVVLSGHLDTVFPGLVDIQIERDGNILRGPGVGDDAAGLAAVVHIARALHEAGVPLRRNVVVVGTVGEEGEGDLHGVKALFSADFPPDRVHAFLSLDLGAQMQVVNEALGSQRLHVTISGPGGHSWGDFGRPNPIHALARAVTEFLKEPLPQGRRSSFNVGVIEGGRGVNVIPESASMRVDMRSEDPLLLQEIDARFRAAVDSAMAQERAWSRIDIPLTLEIETIGDRPAGLTPPESPLVTTAVAAFGSQSMGVVLGSSSTDANWPMSLGIPSLALPHGCQGREAHSLNEWCDTTGRAPVLAAELLAVVGTAELAGPIRPRPQPTD
jgi:tripeptide aminopeptidase